MVEYLKIRPRFPRPILIYLRPTAAIIYLVEIRIDCLRTAVLIARV